MGALLLISPSDLILKNKYRMLIAISFKTYILFPCINYVAMWSTFHLALEDSPRAVPT